MTIQSYTEDLNYVNAKLSENRGARSFLNSFLDACLRADSYNYEILRPALLELMQKYPAKPDRLEAEKRDQS